LLGILVGMTAFGLALTLFDNHAVPGPLHAAMNDSLWGVAELPADVVVYHRFMHAVLGATIASWALALAFVVRYALAARQRWAWWCVVASTLIWFVPDTAASLYYGVWPNALFNAACLLAFAPPLALTYLGREARSPSPRGQAEQSTSR
jgi:hypothetical protein